MTLYLIRWPEKDGTRWGDHTDWVVRASTAAEAIEHVEMTETDYYGDPINYNNELTVTEIPTEGPTETILWYGPDA